MIWHAAFKTTREINAAVNTQENQETILVMRPIFNFNQWWEAQLVSRPTQNINAYRKDRQNRKRRNTVSQSGIAPRKVRAACSQQQRARLWEAMCQSCSSSGFSWYPYSLKYEPRQINCFFLLFVGSLMFNGMKPHSTADYFEDGIVHLAHHGLKPNFMCLCR